MTKIQEPDPIQNGGGGGESTLMKRFSTATVKLSDIFFLAIKRWYWFVLSLCICFFFAWYSIKKAVPLFKQSISVLIRDDVEGGGMGGSSISLRELGLKGSDTVLEDEMEALRSPDLMEQVVNALNLYTLYYSPGTFHANVLYGSSLPVKVSFPDLQPDEYVSFTLHASAEGELRISDLKVNDEEFRVDPNVKLAFGDAVNTPSGRIILQKTPFYIDGTEYTVNVQRLSLAGATDKFSGELSVDMSANKRSNVVEISCVDASKQRADDILQTLMKCYQQNFLKARAQVVTATNDFISQRLTAVEEELAGVDNSISAYKSSNLIPDVSQTSTMFMQQSNKMSEEIMNYNNQLQMARYLKNYIYNEGRNQMLPINTGLENKSIESMVTQYNTLIMQRNSLLENSSESNPIVIEYNSQLAALRSSILSSIDNTIVSLTNAVQNMERREQSSTAKVAASPQQAKYLLSAERKQKVQENLYLYLLQKREENELSQTLISLNTRILRQPKGPKRPISPKPAQTYIIAFIIGLAIPLGSIYALEVSNNKVRGRKDLEGMTIPVVGEIPAFKRSRNKTVAYFKKQRDSKDDRSVRDDIVVEDGNRNMINEAIRVLRSNITRMTGEQVPTVIMVTSFNPGSGKTFLTLNLGLSLALKHHRVLLIDGDLRRASLSKFAGSPRKGIADYLSGSCKDIETVIKKNCIAEGLDLLPVGAIPPNPTELLESQRFEDLIAYLKTEYDYIFIDCPPGEMMADAQIIGDISDRTIFVARVGLFQRNMLPELEHLYKTKKYPNMMLVLNDSMTGTKYGYYSYGYGYSKKAGYGYGE